MGRLRAADGARPRAPRPDEPGDARRHLDRFPPTGRTRASAPPAARTVDRHAGKQSRRGVGGGRVLDRADLEDRSRRQPRGIAAKYYESKREPGGEPVTLDEYYADIFEHAVPGLPEAAREEGLEPLEYMRRYGAFAVPYAGQRPLRSGARRIARRRSRVTATAAPASRRRAQARGLLGDAGSEWGWPEHTRCPATSAATCTGESSTRPRKARWCCCRRSGCRP